MNQYNQSFGSSLAFKKIVDLFNNFSTAEDTLNNQNKPRMTTDLSEVNLSEITPVAAVSETGTRPKERELRKISGSATSKPDKVLKDVVLSKPDKVIQKDSAISKSNKIDQRVLVNSKPSDHVVGKDLANGKRQLGSSPKKDVKSKRQNHG